MIWQHYVIKQKIKLTYTVIWYKKHFHPVGLSKKLYTFPWNVVLMPPLVSTLFVKSIKLDFLGVYMSLLSFQFISEVFLRSAEHPKKATSVTQKKRGLIYVRYCSLYFLKKWISYLLPFWKRWRTLYHKSLCGRFRHSEIPMSFSIWCYLQIPKTEPKRLKKVSERFWNL